MFALFIYLCFFFVQFMYLCCILWSLWWFVFGGLFLILGFCVYKRHKVDHGVNPKTRKTSEKHLN